MTQTTEILILASSLVVGWLTTDLVQNKPLNMNHLAFVFGVLVMALTTILFVIK